MADAPIDIVSLCPDVLRAGACILAHRDAGVVALEKGDRSPVTAADREAEQILLAALARIAPGIPVVAEEQASEGQAPTALGDRFFLVDPLDGTKEFIRGGTDFTVNVGLVEGDAPVAGIVYAPARGTLWCGDVRQGKAWIAEVEGDRLVGQRPIAVRPCAGIPTAVASASHNTPATEAWLAACGVAERVSVGSSLKFALVASGEADVYPRAGPTMEWDTAAGDAVLRAAGGRTLCVDGALFRYRKPGFRNPGFVATGCYEPRPLRPFMTETAA